MHDTSHSILSCFARFNYATKNYRTNVLGTNVLGTNVWCWYLQHHEVSTTYIDHVHRPIVAGTEWRVLSDGHSMTGPGRRMSNPKPRNRIHVEHFFWSVPPLGPCRSGSAFVGDAPSSLLLMATEIALRKPWHCLRTKYDSDVSPSLLFEVAAEAKVVVNFSFLVHFCGKGLCSDSRKLVGFFSLALIPRSPSLWVDTLLYFPFCVLFFPSSPLGVV